MHQYHVLHYPGLSSVCWRNLQSWRSRLKVKVIWKGDVSVTYLWQANSASISPLNKSEPPKKTNMSNIDIFCLGRHHYDQKMDFRFSDPLGLRQGWCQIAFLCICLKMVSVQCHLKKNGSIGIKLLFHLWSCNYTFLKYLTSDISSLSFAKKIEKTPFIHFLCQM